MSHWPSLRGKRRWSVGRQLDESPVLIAELPAWRARVGVGPPLPASGPSLGSCVFAGTKHVESPMLKSFRSASLRQFGVLAQTIELCIFTSPVVLGLPIPPPVSFAIVVFQTLSVRLEPTRMPVPVWPLMVEFRIVLVPAPMSATP